MPAGALADGVGRLLAQMEGENRTPGKLALGSSMTSTPIVDDAEHQLQVLRDPRPHQLRCSSSTTRVRLGVRQVSGLQIHAPVT